MICSIMTDRHPLARSKIVSLGPVQEDMKDPPNVDFLIVY